MALRPFELHRPRALAEALAVLHEYGEAASPIAGGTELLIALKARVLHYEHLIDLKQVPGLRGVRRDDDGRICIGALSTHHQLATDELMVRHLPAYAALSGNIANIRVRCAGTLGGNLCFAEPHADPPALLCALGAELLLEGVAGSRRVPMHDFITGDFSTVRGEDELLTQVQVPPLAVGARFAYASFGQLHRPAVGVAVGRDAQSGAAGWRVWVGAVSGRPVRLVQVEAALAEAASAEAARAEAAPAEAERAEPAPAEAGRWARRAAEQAMSAVAVDDDMHGSADYKRHLAAVLVGQLTARVLQPPAAEAQPASGGTQ